ncbi:MAG: hypothetical protein HYV33_02760 [Candidatus Kerfeldbacteria bacterium]|nr:hypothetical protein [Candidatus Kerfeldbacteria bacterium]
MRKLLVDYHFHPNLSKYDSWANHKCQAIWREFSAQRLDVVVITEHVFKNPARAYRLLLKTRPADATTVIFPGLEALTKEGVDLIIFSEQETIFSYRELMIPKQRDVFEMIAFIKARSNLCGSIAHPYSIGHSGIKRQLGASATERAIRLLGGVEIHNNCFSGGMKVADVTGVSTIIRRQRTMMDYTLTLPAQYFSYPEVQLYSGGSDAHVVIEIGTGMLVPAGNDLFQSIATNRSTDFHVRQQRIKFWLGIYKLYSIITESLIKAFRLYEGKIYQHDDQFSNFYSEAEKETVLELRHRRIAILKPMLNAMTYAHLSPTELNMLALIAITLSAITVKWWPVLAVISFAIYLWCSSLTGALAHYQKVESETGAITKIILQQFALTVVILMAMALDWISGLWGTMYLLLYTVMIWLMILLNKIGQPIRIIFRSRYVIFLAICVFIFFKINIINQLLIGFSSYMAITTGWMFIKWRRAYLL